MKIKYTKSLVDRFDSILARGLCSGVGDPSGQMCIEAAVCAALGLPHGGDPECVAPAVRDFKITLNDCRWSSPDARAKGLRNLGLAQIGSKGVVDDKEFTRRLSEKVIRRLLPDLFRRFDDPKMKKAADLCEKEGTTWAAEAAEATWAARAATWAAEAAAEAATWAPERDYFLTLVANLALEVLVELKSPGVKLLSLGKN